jgi:hypothetical protein
VRVSAPDETLTGYAGVLAVTELVTRLDLVGTLDDYVSPIKQRDRGLSAGSSWSRSTSTPKIASRSDIRPQAVPDVL